MYHEYAPSLSHRPGSHTHTFTYVYSTYVLLTDDSTVAMLEAVSPVDQVLDPPEKLVIEVESSGGYFRHAWYMNDEEMYPNGDVQFREVTPERFSEFFQVFVQDPTTTSDHGVYRVELIDETTPAAIVLKTQEFTVTPPGRLFSVGNSCIVFSGCTLLFPQCL